MNRAIKNRQSLQNSSQNASFLSCLRCRGKTWYCFSSKKQTSTKLPQNFCCSAWGKQIPRLHGLGNWCTSTSCHSVTMPILALHLICRCNWNGNCYGKWCAAESLSQKVERYFTLLILFINGQNMVSNDANWWKTDIWPQNHCPIIVPTFFSNVPTFSRALGHCPQLWNFLAEHC